MYRCQQTTYRHLCIYKILDIPDYYLFGFGFSQNICIGNRLHNSIQNGICMHPMKGRETKKNNTATVAITYIQL